MKVIEFTGVTEKSAILLTKGFQVLELITDAVDFVNEEMEIELVDMISGKSTPIQRTEKIILLAEPCAQGGNLRQQASALFEVSDGRDLELNANRVLRVNLSKLDAAKTYTLYAIESGIPMGTPIIWDPLYIANGVKLQKFPIADGSLLVLPKTDLADVRILYSDNTELRMDAAEMNFKAAATNGIIEVDAAQQPTKIGSNKAYIIDLNLLLPTGQTKRVTEIEVRLLLGNGYTMYKITNMENAGFDWKF